MYLVFPHKLGESYRRRLRSLLLCSCDVFRAKINSLCLLILQKRCYNNQSSYNSLTNNKPYGFCGR